MVAMKKKESIIATPSFNPVNFGRYLTQCLTEKKVSKNDLSIQIGLTTETITDFELGKQRPSAETMVAMAQVFQINAVQFLRNAFDKPFGTSRQTA